MKFNYAILIIFFNFNIFAENLSLEDSLLKNAESTESKLETSYKKGGFQVDLLSGSEFKSGDVVLLKIQAENPSLVFEAKAIFSENEVPFFKVSETSSKEEKYSLVGIPINHKSSKAEIAVNIVYGEYTQSINIPIMVTEAKETKEIEFITLFEQKVRPGDLKTVKRIADEEMELNEMLMTYSSKKYWDNSFDLPVKGRISSLFGLNRIYNDNPQRRTHWGIDIPVSVGTRIKTSAPGKVVLSKELYFLGKTVVVDHGVGVITLYGHLHNILVKKGQILKDKQIVGLGGRSGKATGSTLHFQAVVSKVKIDPLSLLKTRIHSDLAQK